MKKDLTIIIPAYNEGLIIKKTILEIDKFLPVSDGQHILYVSEDGSSDNTRNEVDSVIELVKNSIVKLSSPSKRLGYSEAVLRGLRECNTEFVFFTDADGQLDPSELQNFFNSLTEKGYVVGFRNPRMDGIHRKIYSKFFKIAYLIAGGPKLKDPSSPFLLARKKDLEFLEDKKFHLNFGFWWEFQIRAANQKLPIIEIPITHRVRQEGSTQVYKLSKILGIAYSHLIGLKRLRDEIRMQQVTKSL